MSHIVEVPEAKTWPELLEEARHVVWKLQERLDQSDTTRRFVASYMEQTDVALAVQVNALPLWDSRHHRNSDLTLDFCWRMLQVQAKEIAFAAGLSVVDKSRPVSGVAIIVQDSEGKILFGQRTGTSFNGYWCFPGGHQEWMEEFEVAGLRELREEAGLSLRVSEPKYLQTINVSQPGVDHHAVVSFVICNYLGGYAQDMPGSGMVRWGWYLPWQFPKPVLKPVQLLYAQPGFVLPKATGPAAYAPRVGLRERSPVITPLPPESEELQNPFTEKELERLARFTPGLRGGNATDPPPQPQELADAYRVAQEQAKSLEQLG